MLAVLGGCGGTGTTEPAAPVRMPPGSRGPVPLTLRVQGEGTAMHPVYVDATIGEVHEALIRASSRRVTGTDAEAAGLEILVFDERTVDSLIRAVRPMESPELTWMGVPVRWHTAASAAGCDLHVRSWPIITELGPRCVVDYRLHSETEGEVRDELLLVPGEAMAFVAGGPGWPVPFEAINPGASVAASAMEWEGSSEVPPVGLILLVPRFDAGR